MIGLRELAQHCGLSVSTTNRAVLSLTKQRLIQYRRGYNQNRPSIFEIPQEAGESLSAKGSAVRGIGVPPPSDKRCIPSDLYTGDRGDRIAVHRENADSDNSAEDGLARQIAGGLDDLKNLRLYQSYCRRYPAVLVLKAYIRAKEISPDKIKKSRGALFNHLVSKVYGKENKTKPDSGAASG